MIEERRFIADSMLGKLARWMRTLGYDVEYERAIDDGLLIRKAVAEGRIVLTRDTLLLKRRGLRGRAFFIESDQAGEQLREVLKAFPKAPGKFLSRCLRCNADLAAVEKESVREKVPPYVFQTQEAFSTCLKCGRIYWAGTHRERMVEEVESMEKNKG